MSGSCLRARAALLISLALGILLVPLVAPAAGKKIRGPSARVKSIPAAKFHPGHKRFKGVLPLGNSPTTSGNESSQPAAGGLSAQSASAQASALPGAGPPVLFNQPGLSDSRFAPPDSTGAIGPDYYVEMVNEKIGVYDRQNLSLISSAQLDTQFTTGGQFFDVQIQWDQQAQRWFYVGIGPYSYPDGSYTLAFGWSKTTDPRDVDSTDGTIGWCQYYLPSGQVGGYALVDDYPKLGHDDNHLVIGSNVMQSFGYLGFNYLFSRIWAIPKPALGTSTCPAAPVASSFGTEPDPLRTADGDKAWTPVPANTIESTDKGYVVATDNPNNFGSRTASQIMAWHVSGAANSPVLVQDGNMNIATYSNPPNVPQPGSTSALDTISSRLTQAVADTDPDAGGAKAVWSQHTVTGAGGRSEVRWYELIPATLTVRQAGTVSSSLHYVFNAAISPTRTGNEAVIYYNIGSSSQLPQIAARSRQSSDALGQMSGETILSSSMVPMNCADFGDVCRWGDYSGASPDQGNAHAVWGTNMLTGSTMYQWGTRNFAVSVMRPRQATFEDGQILNPLTGFDSATGYLELKTTGWTPAPYEGSYHLRALNYPQLGPPLGRYSQALPNGSDIWYGSGFYIDGAFRSATDYAALLEWSDPVSGAHGGVSLRPDDQYHVVRGTTANPAGDTTIGPAFSLLENRYIWVEVHQRLDPANPLTEVFVDGRLISTSAAQNGYPDSIGIPSRISYGIGTISGNVFQLHLDRASMDVREAGPVGAPGTPTGFTGSGQDRTTVMYWNAVAGATGYHVYKQATDGTWFERFNTTTTAVFEPGLTNCTTYRYRVAAYNSAGLESVVSDPITLTPKATNQQC
jgi:hypothetical protein